MSVRSGPPSPAISPTQLPERVQQHAGSRAARSGGGVPQQCRRCTARPPVRRSWLGGSEQIARVGERRQGGALRPPAPSSTPSSLAQACRSPAPTGRPWRSPTTQMPRWAPPCRQRRCCAVCSWPPSRPPLARQSLARSRALGWRRRLGARGVACFLVSVMAVPQRRSRRRRHGPPNRERGWARARRLDGMLRQLVLPVGVHRHGTPTSGFQLQR